MCPAAVLVQLTLDLFIIVFSAWFEHSLQCRWHFEQFLSVAVGSGWCKRTSARSCYLTHWTWPLLLQECTLWHTW